MLFGNRKGLLIELMLLIIIGFTVLESPTVYAQNGCITGKSVADKTVITTSDKPCQIPFQYMSKEYTDCALNHDNIALCPTDCAAKTGAFETCKWTKAMLGLPGCSALPNSTASVEPPTTTPGGKCMFPFFKNNVCHTDCIKDSDSEPYYCSKTPVYSGDFLYCYYTKDQISKIPSCSNIESSKVDNDMDVFGTTNKSCYFPFKKGNMCYNDCIVDGKSSWCSNSKVFEKDKSFCKYPIVNTKFALTNYYTICATYSVDSTDCQFVPYIDANATNNSYIVKLRNATGPIKNLEPTQQIVWHFRAQNGDAQPQVVFKTVDLCAPKLIFQTVGQNEDLRFANLSELASQWTLKKDPKKDTLYTFELFKGSRAGYLINKKADGELYLSNATGETLKWVLNLMKDTDVWNSCLPPTTIASTAATTLPPGTRSHAGSTTQPLNTQPQGHTSSTLHTSLTTKNPVTVPSTATFVRCSMKLISILSVFLVFQIFKLF